jgi:hypothetical protein
VPTDAPAVSPKKKGGRPNVGAPILVDALRRALADHGRVFRPDTEKAAVHAVWEEEVRKRFADAYPAGEGDEGKAREATSLAYKRTLQAACAEDKVGKGVEPGGLVMLWFKVMP